MTLQLRSHASEHGWDSDVVNNMHVEHNEGKYSVKVHPDYAARAHEHEYGTETKTPTAAIRKFTNRPEAAQTAYVMSFRKHVGGRK
jgi:hypothetical protein